MRRLSLWSRLGNAAAVLFGPYGAVSGQARQCGCSRQTVYDHAGQVQEILAEAERPGPSRQALWEENRRLREENRQLWDWLEESFSCPPAKQRQFAVQAAALGLSLRQTLTLLAVLLPASLVPGRATLGHWVQQEARRAGRLLAIPDEACRRLVVCLCLDEIFCRRQPVLMAVEPFSYAWVVGARARDRSGPTWARVLAAWPEVQDVAADGGTGIELGLHLAGARRQEEATRRGTPAKPFRVRLDLFHTRREGQRALRTEWAAAQRLWEEAEKAQRAKARYDRGGGNGNYFNRAVVAKAWAAAEAAFWEAERKEKAWHRAVAALGIFRSDGTLNERSWAAAELQAAAAELGGSRWAKVRRMLLDPRTLTFLDGLHEELTGAEPCPQRRQALAVCWRRRQAARRARGEAAAWAVLQQRLAECVCRRWGADEEAYGRVSRVLRRVVRASSAVEGINSVVRMHQARHRKLTQELIDHKRLAWNCRRFGSGKRRGRCPYEHLGLRLPSYDLWPLLQTDPDVLKQQLSSQGVAA
jgi:hypothetical protein